MDIKVRQIVEGLSQMSSLMQKELPVKASYAIAKNVNKLESILKVYNAEKEKLLNKYAKKDENGKVVVNEQNMMTIEPEHIEAWNKEHNELLDITNDVNIHKFPLSCLDSCVLAPKELAVIEYMIEE